MKLVQTFDFTLEDSMVAQDVSELRQCSLTGSRLCRNHVPNVQVVWVNPSSKSRQP